MEVKQKWFLKLKKLKTSHKWNKSSFSVQYEVHTDEYEVKWGSSFQHKVSLHSKHTNMHTQTLLYECHYVTVNHSVSKSHICIPSDILQREI